MKAIVEINGKQYQVEEGRYLQVDTYDAPPDQAVLLDRVCMIVAGNDSLVGAPYVDGATVKTVVRRHARGPKILVYKMRCKKGYRRKNGHRQGFTELQVQLVDFPGRDNFPPPPEAVAPPARPVKAKPEPVAKASAEPKAPAEEKASAKPAAPKKAASPKPPTPKSTQEGQDAGVKPAKKAAKPASSKPKAASSPKPESSPPPAAEPPEAPAPSDPPAPETDS